MSTKSILPYGGRLGLITPGRAINSLYYYGSIVITSLVWFYVVITLGCKINRFEEIALSSLQWESHQEEQFDIVWD